MLLLLLFLFNKFYFQNKTKKKTKKKKILLQFFFPRFIWPWHNFVKMIEDRKNKKSRHTKKKTNLKPNFFALESKVTFRKTFTLKMVQCNATSAVSATEMCQLKNKCLLNVNWIFIFNYLLSCHNSRWYTSNAISWFPDATLVILK